MSLIMQMSAKESRCCLVSCTLVMTCCFPFRDDLASHYKLHEYLQTLVNFYFETPTFIKQKNMFKSFGVEKGESKYAKKLGGSVCVLQ